MGKSTLLNALMGEKVAITSKKPQTTRNRITGILSKDETQYVFLDTPGIHKPQSLLGEYMVKAANGSINDVDAVIFVVEPSNVIHAIEQGLLERFKKSEIPVILAINKIDSIPGEKIAKLIEMYTADCEFASVIPISALKNDGVDIIMKELNNYLVESDWFFPEDVITDQPERQIVAEVIREKLLRLLDDEIPHGVAVVVESFKESKGMLDIRAEIFCERASHKSIIIGKNGDMIKKVGTYAREDLEKFFGQKIYLNLWLKVKEKWRDNSFLLGNFGYTKVEK